MTDNIEVMRRRADREEWTLMLAVIEAPARLYISRLRRALIFQTGSCEGPQPTHSLTYSLTHLSSDLLDHENTRK